MRLSAALLDIRKSLRQLPANQNAKRVGDPRLGVIRLETGLADVRGRLRRAAARGEARARDVVAGVARAARLRALLHRRLPGGGVEGPGSDRAARLREGLRRAEEAAVELARMFEVARLASGDPFLGDGVSCIESAPQLWIQSTSLHELKCRSSRCVLATPSGDGGGLRACACSRGRMGISGWVGASQCLCSVLGDEDPRRPQIA